MKGLAKTTLWEFLELIREKTRENIIVIKKNNEVITSKEREELFQELDNPKSLSEMKEQNTQLYAENHELLELHKDIIKLAERHSLYAQDEFADENMEEYENSNAEEEKLEEVTTEKNVVLEPAKYMEKAMNGTLEYSPNEPWLKDKDVFDKVYNSLLTAERYEECQKLVEARQKSEKSSNKETKIPFLNRLMFWNRIKRH